MPSGHYLTKEQVAYIVQHKDDLSPGQIAKQLQVERRCVVRHIRSLESTSRQT